MSEVLTVGAATPSEGAFTIGFAVSAAVALAGIGCALAVPARAQPG